MGWPLLWIENDNGKTIEIGSWKMRMYLSFSSFNVITGCDLPNEGDLSVTFITC